MREFRNFIWMLVILSVSVIVSAEDLTITTYYPSPFGSYDQLTTANDTFLATTAGMVGIGNTAPTEKLDVTGNARVTGTLTAASLVSTGEARIPGVIRQIQRGYSDHYRGFHGREFHGTGGSCR